MDDFSVYGSSFENYLANLETVALFKLNGNSTVAIVIWHIRHTFV